MSAKLKHQQAPSDSGNVVSLQRCCAEGCNKKSDRNDFCTEHFNWFKFGLLTREGKRPIDFDKKYQAYMKQRAA